MCLVSFFEHYFIHHGEGCLVLLNYAEYAIILPSYDVSQILLFTQLLSVSHEMFDS
jgi:hypothetical protein